MKQEFPYYNEDDNSVDWNELDKFDWIQDMHGVEQDPIWHAEGNVYIHTKMVVDALLKLPEFIELTSVEKHILVCSAILHDVEKRSTTTVEDGRIRSHGHSRKGEHTARNLLYKEFPQPFAVRELVCSLIRQHGNPIWWADKEDSNRYVIEISHLTDTKLLYILAKADNLGRTADDLEGQLETLDMFKELCVDNNCYGQPYPFKNGMGKLYYFTHKEAYPDYEPFDETKFEVTLMVAVAGSGKDYYVSQELCDKDVISLDDIREEFGVKHGDSKGNGRVIQEAKERAKKLMRTHTDFVWNSTNITRQMRRQMIDLFTSYGGKVKIVYIEVPYKKLLTQNAQREDALPASAIEKMIRKLEIPSQVEASEVIYVINE